MAQSKILVFAGSIRTGALSQRLAAAATKELALLDAEPTLISLSDYPMPIYDGDLEARDGAPENARKLRRMMLAHRGIFIATPEYNASIPPLLKNTLDWVSRISRDGDQPLRPYSGLTVGLCSTSDGMFAGMRGLYHLRAVLMAVGTQVVTEQCSVGRASVAFNEDGTLKDERSAKMLTAVCQSVISRVG